MWRITMTDLFRDHRQMGRGPESFNLFQEKLRQLDGRSAWDIIFGQPKDPAADHDSLVYLSTSAQFMYPHEAQAVEDVVQAGAQEWVVTVASEMAFEGGPLWVTACVT